MMERLRWAQISGFFENEDLGSPTESTSDQLFLTSILHFNGIQMIWIIIFLIEFQWNYLTIFMRFSIQNFQGKNYNLILWLILKTSII